MSAEHYNIMEKWMMQ